MTENELINAFGVKANEWLNLTRREQYGQATRLSREFVEVCKGLIMKPDISVDQDVRSKALILGSPFSWIRGLY